MAKTKKVTRKTARVSAPVKKKAHPKRKASPKLAAAKPRKSNDDIIAEQHRKIRQQLSSNNIEKELNHLIELLKIIRDKNDLLKKSLHYLENEQKKVAQQIQLVRKYLGHMKDAGLKKLKHFPENAEEIYGQVKKELKKFSKRWTA